MPDFHYNAKSAHTVYFHPSPKRVRVKKSIEDVKIKNKKKKVRFWKAAGMEAGARETEFWTQILWVHTLGPTRYQLSDFT